MASPTGQPTSKMYTVEYWRPLLERFTAEGEVGEGIPVEACLAWIKEESGGNPADLGAPYEVGIFQLDLEDGPAWGGTLDTLHGNFTDSATSKRVVRPLTTAEEELQVRSGLQYLQHARNRAHGLLAAKNIDWGEGRDFWAYVKLYHALPRLTDNYFNAAAGAGGASDWDSYRAWVQNLSQSDAAEINSAVATRYYPFDKYFSNAENVGNAVAGG